MNILHDQPLFSVRLNTFGIRYILKLNGITLLRETSSNGQLTTSIPVNHWMKPGENTMEVQIRPHQKGEKFNPNAKLEFKLLVNNNSFPDTRYKISDIIISGESANNSTSNTSSASGKLDPSNNFKMSEDGDVIIYDISIEEIKKYKGGLALKRNLYIPSSLPLWAFFTSDDVPDLESMSDEDYYNELEVLLKEYLKVQNAIESKNIDAIIPLFNERNIETDAAYYLSKGETEQGLKESLIETANDPELEILPLEKRKVNFTIEQNRKLVRLSRKGIKPAIALNFKDGSGSQRYQMFFRIKDGKWILSR